MGTCVEACSGDANCDLDSKCCSNGCGHGCFKAVSNPGKLLCVGVRARACMRAGVRACVRACV